MNPAVWVERHGRQRPDEPALADGERLHAGWGAFAARTASVAAALRDDFGLTPGSRVAIVMRNRPEYLEALFAIWHAGLVAVPVNARLHRDEIAYILDHSESAVVVTDADHAGEVESLVGTVASLQAAVVAPGERWDRLAGSSPVPLVDRQPEDPAWLFYTSGTTGRPKGATLTHRNLLMASLSYFADIDPVMPHDCILHAAPLSHGSGLYGLPHVARGAVSVVPQSGGVDGDEIAYILDHSESAVVVTDADHAGDVEPLVGTVPSLQTAVVAPGERWDRLTASAPAPLVDRQPGDPAWLFYTSGTTGQPKGATLTHRNLLMASLSYFADIDPVMPQDGILHAAPLSHGSGLYGLPHVARGAVSVVPQSGGVDGDEIAALLRRWPGMSFFAAPTMVKRLAGDPAVATADLSNLKTIIYGGAPMYLADLEEALAVFGPRLAQIYGQGESPMTITGLSKADHADRDHPRWRDRVQSVGVPRTDVEVRVVDEDDRELPAGEVGEVVVRGDVVMAGYWKNPDATAETLRGGWLHTGDVGSFDADGYLTLRDRSKDLIISGGMNIYPREVEEALLRHPGIRAAAVVGRPDAEWGEAVVAFVVAADGATPPPAAELDRTCLDHIARYKRP
ncbi:MAG TPA: AMP-binding protein, partial [Acidimicrobiales bacterium]